jgi:hypothetical protein
VTLRPARDDLWRRAKINVVLALVGGALIVLVFDEPPSELLAPALLGVLIWGAMGYALEARRSVPHGELLPVPAYAAIAPARPVHDRSTLVVVPLVVALAWFASEWELGGFFLPGMWLGYAISWAVAAAQVARWEGANARTVLAGEAGRQLYAGEPVSGASGARVTLEA